MEGKIAGHMILQKGHKGQGEATDAAKHCMHEASEEMICHH